MGGATMPARGSGAGRPGDPYEDDVFGGPDAAAAADEDEFGGSDPRPEDLFGGPDMPVVAEDEFGDADSIDEDLLADPDAVDEDLLGNRRERGR
jgi:hypothetical protein